MARDIVIVDLDNTLADASWRSDLIQSQGWDAFHAAGKDDQPVPAVVDLVNALFDCGRFTIFCITNRNRKFQQMTINWIMDHSIRLHELVMRPNDDFRPAEVLKVAIAQDLGIDRIAMLIEDHEPTSAAFRAFGVTTIMVAHDPVPQPKSLEQV